VARGDRPCVATEEDIAWFLDLSFPEMGPVVGEDGKPTGKYELKNKPFATQILEAVNERGQHLGNGSRG
jgi:hypothetical protein